MPQEPTRNTNDIAELNAAKPYIRSALAFILLCVRYQPEIKNCYIAADYFIARLEQDLGAM